MHHGSCSGFGKPKSSLGSLMDELNLIKDDMHYINNMDVPEDVKTPFLAELRKQINEIKEKMHDCIDTL